MFDPAEGKLNQLPTLPGVYLMKDEGGEVIYIGKAKSIRARVKNYFSGSDDRRSIPHILKKLDHIEHVVTETEQQAFVLERDLIQQYKPRYNIRLKDDKAYLMVRIDENADWPRLELVRKRRKDGARYFGPYTFSYELKMVLDLIKKVVPLRTCTDSVFHNRLRPCLEYQIKRCSGPCCLEVSRDEYLEWVSQAISILSGNTAPLIEELEKQMERASENMLFEDAVIYRDRIEVIQNFTEKKQLQDDGESRDVFSLYREERLVALSVLVVRNGRISNNISFFLEEQDFSDEEILESVVSQYYIGKREAPEEIILPLELTQSSMIKDGLRGRQTKGVPALQIIVPKRGVKFRLLGLADLNAKQQFISHFNQEARYREVSETLSQQFALKQMPRKIECIDISNLGGSDIVGGLVCFYDGVPLKKGYRTYHISVQGKPDDFASIHEIVTRRIASGVKNDDLPDLLVIDGGLGQLSKAIEAREDSGVPLDIISIAKMRTTGKGKTRSSHNLKSPERVFIAGKTDPIDLVPNAETTLFLQRLRDAVHDAAISFHRKTRAKRMKKSVLDDILGVGPERKNRLLKAFGSIKKIKNAEAKEIAKIGRMPLPLAEKILSHLLNVSK